MYHSEAGFPSDKILEQASSAATALDSLQKQVGTFTGMPQGITNLTTTIGTLQTGQTSLASQVTDVVNKVDGLVTAVAGVPAEAKVKELVEAGPTGLVTEVKSASDVLKTLATKADLEDWSKARAEAQAKSNQEAISLCVKAALKDFQDSTVAEYTQKLGRYEAADEQKREVFNDLKNKALALEGRYEERGQRLAALEKENAELRSALQKRDQELASRSSRLDGLTRDLAEAEARIGRRDSTIAGINERIGKRDTAITEAHKLVQSYEEAIKARDSAMEEMRNRLEAAEAQPTPPMTEAQRGAEMSELARMYLALSTEFQDIPIAPEGSGCFDMEQLALEIAPVLIQIDAKAHLEAFLQASRQGWYCLGEVVMIGAGAPEVLSGRCQRHRESCNLVSVVDFKGKRVLDFLKR